MINLIVIGGGEATYKSLWPVIQSKEIDMRIAVVIDIVPKEKLHPKMQEIIEQEKILYLCPDELKRGASYLDDNSVGVVATPNEFHLRYANFFTSIGMPVYVEKPMATSLSELSRFLMSEKNRRHVYGAEYCVDGKMVAFLEVAGVMSPDDPRRAYVKVSEGMTNIYHRLGRLLSIRGKVLEGEGTAGIADHRAWLLEGNHGGMIRDLFSHLFGPLYEVGLVSSDVVDLQVKLGKYEQGLSLGQWRPLKNRTEGETYAAIKGGFLTPNGEPIFEIEVGKYWLKHDRFLALTFEHGSLKMSYEKPFTVTIQTESLSGTASVTADFYPTLAFLNFKRFLEGKTHGHIGRSIAIVKLNEQVREVGLEQAGL